MLVNHKLVLFYVVLSMFITTFILTILGLTKIIDIEETYLKGLFFSLIVELIASVIGLFKATDFFSEIDRQPNGNIIKILPTDLQNMPKSDVGNEFEGVNIELDSAKVETVPNLFNKSVVLIEESKTHGNIKSNEGIRVWGSLNEILEYIDIEMKNGIAHEVNRECLFNRIIGDRYSGIVEIYSVQKQGEKLIYIFIDGRGLIYSNKLELSQFPVLKYLKIKQSVNISGEIKSFDSVLTMTITMSDISIPTIKN